MQHTSQPIAITGQRHSTSTITIITTSSIVHSARALNADVYDGVSWLKIELREHDKHAERHSQANDEQDVFCLFTCLVSLATCVVLCLV